MNGTTDWISRIPIERPFRFVDEVLEVDETKVRSTYRFREDEFFFPAHFPSFPVVPASILLECMGQGGSLVHGLYLANRMGPEWGREYFPVFSDADRFEVRRPVRPGDTVHICGKKIFFRMGKLRSRVELLTPQGELIASAELGGILTRFKQD